MGKSLRILYAAGPGDIIGTYHYWKAGHDDPSQVAVTYSHQFYDVCSALGATAYVISSCATKSKLRDGAFILEHRPIPLEKERGISYHVGQLYYGLWLLLSAIKFKASVAVISSGTTHWFLLSLYPLFGISVIPSLHCVLWAKFGFRSRAQQWLMQLGQHLFAKVALSTLVISDDVANQVLTLARKRTRPIFPFLPTYRQEQFAGIESPSKFTVANPISAQSVQHSMFLGTGQFQVAQQLAIWMLGKQQASVQAVNRLRQFKQASILNELIHHGRLQATTLKSVDCIHSEQNPQPIFRVLYAGRIEVNKGALDLLAISRRFSVEGYHTIHFDVCGEGAALKALQRGACRSGLEHSFVCHGHCDKQKMRQLLEQCHVVIVPTQTSFNEGFNKVVIEGVLSGRPVITSAVCPSLALVRSAAIEVPPNDTQAYGDAILTLYHNPDIYQQKQQACLSLQEMFYNSAYGWGASLTTILKHYLSGTLSAR